MAPGPSPSGSSGRAAGAFRRLSVLALSALGCADAAPMRVAVTGAGGQTGGHAFRKLLARPELFSPVGIVRNEASREALLAASDAKAEQVIVADVSAAATDADGGTSKAALAAALAGCAALLIGTSAKVKPTGGVNAETGRPNMGFPDGQPYAVDWLGQRAQIEAARSAGVQQVVICSSMGGTDANHMLNRFGKSADGKSGGGILQWKRKAEKYLTDSGLTYTIVHPGGLINEPGGRREILVGVDDKLLAQEARSIPREDVAEVMVQSLLHDDFKNRAFDCVAKPETGGDVVATDFATLLQPLSGSNCDYGLGVIPDAAAEKVEEDAMAAAV
eukprot:TRINITY_DN51389_c0_g2_i1.p2 TRINITY_DN51389_c0_g2~~TRINITY_DN51389_c0_g2_i1.p2  ORF type:complete len:332 (+),score=106.09 TRINITY_DN51389_c0_g2_i1:80-1075(+)